MISCVGLPCQLTPLGIVNGMQEKGSLRIDVKVYLACLMLVPGNSAIAGQLLY
jgi:hypothetical protein